MATYYFWQDCGTKCSCIWSSALPQYFLYVLNGQPWIRAWHWPQTPLVCGTPSGFKSTCSSILGLYEFVNIQSPFSWFTLKVTTGKTKAACLNSLSLKRLITSNSFYLIAWKAQLSNGLRKVVGLQSIWLFLIVLMGMTFSCGFLHAKLKIGLQQKSFHLKKQFL